MKPQLLILSCALLCATLNAQPEASDDPTQKSQMEIFSDSGEFDLKTHVVVYRGNVRVVDPKMKLWCEILTATTPPAGGRIENIVAETNVVLIMTDEKGETNRATGDKLVYSYKVADGVTNELAVLTGNPKIEKPSLTVIGDVIEWDRGNNQLRVKNQRMIFSTDESGSHTNPPPAVNDLQPQ